MRLQRATMRCVVVLCAVALAGIAVREGFAAPPDGDAAAIAAADAKILGEIREHSEVMQNLEYLSDSIGARLTGSPLTKQANDWTAAKMKEYGLVNVHLERGPLHIHGHAVRPARGL